jgi:hypothetical protein
MSFHEQVHVIGHDFPRHKSPAVTAGIGADQLLTPALDPASQDRGVVLRAPHHLIPKVANATCGNLHLPGHAGDYTYDLCQTTRFPAA